MEIDLDPIPLPPSVIGLEDQFNGSLIGQSIEPTRLAYSLNGMTRAVMRIHDKSLEHAQEHVGQIVSAVIAQHGDNAPLFIDDTISRPNLAKEKSRIIVPGKK